MNPEKVLKGKRVLIVDDEEDILQFLTELLDMCKIDQATTFEKAKELLEKNFYHAAVLDIMGVRGYELLEIAKKKDIPTLMLTAHALSKENLKKSFEMGADYYVPKDEMSKVDIYLADILEAKEKKKNVWVKWYERLSGFCDRRFGPSWKDEDPDFWNDLLKGW
ncbi:MAG: response regulator [Deltaproteobacteria bacterium]|nr:response regulator [Deltaproteobacteria bacterium]MBW1930227.1 response regulator [Deltaproteobacteria bacterium]MBW2024290.1 response regulator [Deltaproteobacteria bacterium]RLB18819.1 MAG: response regulator [Deltaproteobacteria bacterium]RLB22977.1 MAG: response regulator [Deltaproteobacteria bacterium]